MHLGGVIRVAATLGWRCRFFAQLCASHRKPRDETCIVQTRVPMFSRNYTVPVYDLAWHSRKWGRILAGTCSTLYSFAVIEQGTRGVVLLVLLGLLVALFR